MTHRRMFLALLTLALITASATVSAQGYQSTCPEGVEGCSPENECTKCHSSCGEYCQNTGDSECGADDCMTCPPGSELERVYGDGTGKCVKGAVKGKLAFVTSEHFDGDLGGLEGADHKCMRLAESGGHPGRFKAWLSDGSTDASSRFMKSSTPYVRTDGTPIAASFEALVSGKLDAALNLDENGKSSGDVGTWTGTDNYGVSESPNCRGWSDSSRDDDNGGSHGCTSTSESGWTSCGEDWCDGRRALYCFEQ